MYYNRIILLLFFALALTVNRAGASNETTEVTVTVDGIGNSPDDAVKNAISEAKHSVTTTLIKDRTLISSDGTTTKLTQETLEASLAYIAKVKHDPAEMKNGGWTVHAEVTVKKLDVTSWLKENMMVAPPINLTAIRAAVTAKNHDAALDLLCEMLPRVQRAAYKAEVVGGEPGAPIKFPATIRVTFDHQYWNDGAAPGERIGELLNIIAGVDAKGNLRAKETICDMPLIRPAYPQWKVTPTNDIVRIYGGPDTRGVRRDSMPEFDRFTEGLLAVTTQLDSDRAGDTLRIYPLKKGDIDRISRSMGDIKLYCVAVDAAGVPIGKPKARALISVDVSNVADPNRPKGSASYDVLSAFGWGHHSPFSAAASRILGENPNSLLIISPQFASEGLQGVPAGGPFLLESLPVTLNRDFPAGNIDHLQFFFSDGTSH